MMMRSKKTPFDRTAWVDKGDTPKERSKRQEERLSRDTGGLVQKASGALDFSKGDIDAVPTVRAVGCFKLEAKTTKFSQFTLKLADLRKIEQEAVMDGEKGGMVISFEDAHDYVVIRKDYLEFSKEGS